jgi:hypothetical protein
MRTLVDTVIRPLAAFVLAAVVANCNDGCLPGYTQIDPATAYAMEVSGCASQRNAQVLECAKTVPTVESYITCVEDADWRDHQCRAQVDRKYGLYLKEGGYPSEHPPAPVR